MITIEDFTREIERFPPGTVVVLLDTDIKEDPEDGIVSLEAIFKSIGG